MNNELYQNKQLNHLLDFEYLKIELNRDTASKLHWYEKLIYGSVLTIICYKLCLGSFIVLFLEVELVRIASGIPNIKKLRNLKLLP